MLATLPLAEDFVISPHDPAASAGYEQLRRLPLTAPGPPVGAAQTRTGRPGAPCSGGERLLEHPVNP